MSKVPFIIATSLLLTSTLAAEDIHLSHLDLQLSAPKEQILTLCPLATSYDQADTLVRESGVRCSLLRTDTPDDFIVLVTDKAVLKLVGSVTFRNGRLEVIKRKWPSIDDPDAQVRDFIATFVHLIEQHAPAEQSMAGVRVKTVRAPDLEGGSVSLRFGDRAVTLTYSRGARGYTLDLEEVFIAQKGPATRPR